MKGGGCILLVPELFFEQDTSGMAQEDQNCSLSHTLRKRFFYSFYHSSNSLKMHYYPHPRHLLSPLLSFLLFPLTPLLSSPCFFPLTLFLAHTWLMDRASFLQANIRKDICQCMEQAVVVLRQDFTSSLIIFSYILLSLPSLPSFPPSPLFYTLEDKTESLVTEYQLSGRRGSKPLVAAKSTKNFFLFSILGQ